jgi:hypothetical protein
MSYVSVELRTKVSETTSVSIIRIDVDIDPDDAANRQRVFYSFI